MNTYASEPKRVVVLGASGFAGQELLRLLARHPHFCLVAAAAASRVGRPIGGVTPGVFVPVDDALGCEPDLLFASLPHTRSMALLGSWSGRAAIDLGGDFRLRDPARYAEFYAEEHTHPESLAGWTYGLSEWHREEIAGSCRVANPGCYPTAALLALAPLLASGMIEPAGIHIDALSGVSGAGRATGEGFDFVSVNENLRAYAPTGHKHIAEMEQELSAVAGQPVVVSFVPHLVPVTRGVLATCTAPMVGNPTTEELLGVFRSRYEGEPFVRVLGADTLPETGRVAMTNLVEVTVRADARSGRAIAIAAIDNLGKGAAGQALQNANLMFGLPQTAGLVAGLVAPGPAS